MKTFSQCDYVNRLERLHRLIRITICLRNYTLSTGNLGHYPTAPHALHLHNSRRSRAQKIGDSLQEKNKLGPAGTRRTITYSLFFFQGRNTFSPWVPDVSFCADISVDYLGDILKQHQSPAGCLPMDLGLAPVLRCC